MAVYTHIEDDELATLLARYDIGELLSFAGIAEGVENSNYLVRTTTAHYILTLYEKRVDEADLPFFIGLMEHLSAKDLQCPVPIQDKTGTILQTCAGRTAAMVSFLDGTSHRFPNREKCAAVGSALAQFHLKSDDFTLDIPIIAKVFDLKGRKITECNSTRKSFNFSELQNGIYILELKQNKINMANVSNFYPFLISR